MKKILLLMLMLLFFNVTANARNMKKDIETVINQSGISKNSTAISIKELKSGKTLYGLNDKILMHPASVQKMMMIVPIMEVLGNDYNFSTELYSRGKSGYVLKLGADPYLTTSDIKTLINKIDPESVKKVYIDDSIIEPKDWGEGWQWDDDLNIYMTRFNAYNLDGNVLKFTVRPTTQNKPAQIINVSKANTVYINNIVTGNENNIKISRNNAAPNIINLDGTIKTTVTEIIPDNNLKNYFSVKLTDSLENRKIYLKEPYKNTSVDSNDKKITEINHPVTAAVGDILLNSNNMVIETLSKIAGGKYYNKQGTDTDGINLFNEYCYKVGLDNDRIRFADASGVSKNNLVDADFITEFLIKNQDNEILKKMAVPGSGTLSDRLLPLKDNLRAKTGTLSDISGIAGFLTSKKGKEYAFSIMINDPSSSSSDKKILEDYLIRSIYFNF